ncbi:MAG: phage holin family protein [Patescibacteria group bacterium]
MLRILLHFIINILLILGLAAVLPDFQVVGFNQAAIFIVILAILNWTLLPIIKILTLPLTLLSLGLFNVILNLVVVIIVANIVDGISLGDSTINQLFIASLISIILAIGNGLVGNLDKSR